MLNTNIQPIDTGSPLVNAQFPSDRERASMEQFIKEYLHDYQPLQAAIRCGFIGGYAKEFSQRYMHHPYVQQRLRDIEQAKYNGLDDNAIKRVRIEEALQREALDMVNGTPQSRIAALNSLKAIYGMDAPTKIQNEVKTASVQIYIPDNGRQD